MQHGNTVLPTVQVRSRVHAATTVNATIPKARGGSTALDRILSLRSSSACSRRRSTTPPPFSPPPQPLPRPLVVVERSLAPLRSLAPPPPARLHDPRPRCVRSDTVAAQHRPQLSLPPRLLNLWTTPVLKREDPSVGNSLKNKLPYPTR